jgi:hypothetical protein
MLIQTVNEMEISEKTVLVVQPSNLVWRKCHDEELIKFNFSFKLNFSLNMHGKPMTLL